MSSSTDCSPAGKSSFICFADGTDLRANRTVNPVVVFQFNKTGPGVETSSAKRTRASGLSDGGDEFGNSLTGSTPATVL
jgi:hypothetical protein